MEISTINLCALSLSRRRAAAHHPGDARRPLSLSILLYFPHFTPSLFVCSFFLFYFYFWGVCVYVCVCVCVCFPGYRLSLLSMPRPSKTHSQVSSSLFFFTHSTTTRPLSSPTRYTFSPTFFLHRQLFCLLPHPPDTLLSIVSIFDPPSPSFPPSLPLPTSHSHARSPRC